MPPSALLVLLALAAPGLALAESATEAVKARDAEVRAALPAPGAEPSPAERARIEALVTRIVDLQAMLERAMGANWAKATPAQRKRIRGAFERRMRQITGGQLDRYRTTDIAYGAEVPGDEGAVTVPTTVVVRGEPTEIAYTLRRGKAGWRIEDIVIDGASTVEAFRGSFAKTIANVGIEGLVRKLEKAAEKPARPPKPAAPAADAPR